jgi:hypothetical protein
MPCWAQQTVGAVKRSGPKLLPRLTRIQIIVSGNLTPGHFVICFGEEIQGRMGEQDLPVRVRRGCENRDAKKHDLVSRAGERWTTCYVESGEAFADGVSPFTSSWH